MGDSGAVEYELWGAARARTNFDVVPPDVGLAAERFCCGFFGGEATGQGFCAIGAAAQLSALVLGQDALPQAIAKARKRALLERDGRDIDTQADDHTLSAARRAAR